LKKSILFPGQGSQYVGMGLDLYNSYQEAKDTYHEVDEALKLKLSDIIFNEGIGDINLTTNTQPAIMTTGVAIFRVLQKQHNIKIENFSYCAGHSLGEYTALVCAGSLSLVDAAKILRSRGEFMQTAVAPGEGSMAAVLGAEVSEIELIINENNYSSIEISNDNCPGQIVISGKKLEVEKCTMDIKKKISKKSIFLPVSAPFHCKLMIPASENMKDLIRDCNLKNPIIPIISNVSANEVVDSKQIKKLLIEQIYKRVRWREIIEYMLKNSVTDFLEIGPGKALSGMLKRFKQEILINSYNSLEDIKN
jgi:[acyl-carrier-protein] S-malonyltransferase